jgi:hypothetical protein
VSDVIPACAFVGKAFTGATTGGSVIAAPGAGKRIRIRRLSVTTDAAASVTVFQGTDAEANRLVYGHFGAGGGEAAYTPHDLPENTALLITTSAGNSRVAGAYQVVAA